MERLEIDGKAIVTVLRKRPVAPQLTIGHEEFG